MKQRTIVIVGLGLIGGSLAAALKGFEDSYLIGVVRRQETADYPGRLRRPGSGGCDHPLCHA